MPGKGVSYTHYAPGGHERVDNVSQIPWEDHTDHHIEICLNPCHIWNKSDIF